VCVYVRARVYVLYAISEERRVMFAWNYSSPEAFVSEFRSFSRH